MDAPGSPGSIPDPVRGREDAAPCAGPCPFFTRGECRSCDLLPAGQAGALAAKEARLREALGPGAPVLPIAGLDDPFGSRGRVKLAVGGPPARPVFGFPDAAGLVRADTAACPLHMPGLVALLEAVRELLPGSGVPPYDVAARAGELKYLCAQRSLDGAMWLQFVARSRQAGPGLRRLSAALRSRFPELLVVSLNIQPVPSAALQGPEEIPLTKARAIPEDLGAARLYHAPGAFSQVTPAVAARLYAAAAERVAAWRPARLVDLFCGSGAFSLAAAQHVASGSGVDASAPSVRSARRAALEAGFAHLEFACGDALEALAGLAPAPDTVLVANPPRRGLGPEVVAAVLRLAPRRLLYSSCNPETLSRDLVLLAPSYNLLEVLPFDMFPLTSHLEALAVLEARAPGAAASSLRPRPMLPP